MSNTNYGVSGLFNVNPQASMFPLATNPLEQALQGKMAAWNSNGPPPAIQTGPSLTAQNIAIPSSLTSTYGNIGTNGYNRINSNYGQAQSQFSNDAAARGLPSTPSPYAANQFATQKGLDIGGLESALGGTAANTAYKGALNQRDFNQQSQLANLIGFYNKPTPLQQAMMGINGAAGTAGTAAGLYSQFGIGKQNNNNLDPNYSSTPAPLSLWGGGSYNPYPSYDVRQIQGGY